MDFASGVDFVSCGVKPTTWPVVWEFSASTTLYCVQAYPYYDTITPRCSHILLLLNFYFFSLLLFPLRGATLTHTVWEASVLPFETPPGAQPPTWDAFSFCPRERFSTWTDITFSSTHHPLCQHLISNRWRPPVVHVLLCHCLVIIHVIVISSVNVYTSQHPIWRVGGALIKTLVVWGFEPMTSCTQKDVSNHSTKLKLVIKVVLFV